ncbi:hypothetical protein [Clostridium pasteurianum]|uniref:hypothetical protein n=1 Tax=Clostridium pasteurianum TaxID=1501 RepID=UPI00353087C1
MFWYIEIFYNGKRKNQVLVYMTPSQFRDKYKIFLFVSCLYKKLVIINLNLSISFYNFLNKI